MIRNDRVSIKYSCPNDATIVCHDKNRVTTINVNKAVLVARLPYFEEAFEFANEHDLRLHGEIEQSVLVDWLKVLTLPGYDWIYWLRKDLPALVDMNEGQVFQAPVIEMLASFVRFDEIFRTRLTADLFSHIILHYKMADKQITEGACHNSVESWATLLDAVGRGVWLGYPPEIAKFFGIEFNRIVRQSYNYNWDRDAQSLIHLKFYRFLQEVFTEESIVLVFFDNQDADVLKTKDLELNELHE